jgi:hypothetical protein
VISTVMSGFAATLLGESSGPAVAAAAPSSAGLRSLV